jgi:hypothetical protein
MADRISFAQSALAAIYASPFMALPLVAASNNWLIGVHPSRWVGPWIMTAIILWIPTAFSNLVGRGLVGLLGDKLQAAAFHLALGLVAAGLLVWFINVVARGSANIGGGPLSGPTQFALIIAAICNAGMIYAVWHFGWKSNLD